MSLNHNHTNNILIFLILFGIGYTTGAAETDESQAPQTTQSNNCPDLTGTYHLNTNGDKSTVTITQVELVPVVGKKYTRYKVLGDQADKPLFISTDKKAREDKESDYKTFSFHYCENQQLFSVSVSITDNGLVESEYTKTKRTNSGIEARIFSLPSEGNQTETVTYTEVNE